MSYPPQGPGGPHDPSSGQPYPPQGPQSGQPYPQGPQSGQPYPQGPYPAPGPTGWQGAGPGGPPPKKRRKWPWVVGVIVLLMVIAAAASPPEEEAEDTASRPGGTTTEERPREERRSSGGEEERRERPEDPSRGDNSDPNRPNRATDDATPDVGSDEPVTVDAITYRVTSARATPTIGDQEFGLGEEADGVFVVVEIEATSHKDETATLTDTVFRLGWEGSPEYEPDSEGTVAAVGAGEEPFFLEDLQPDTSATGTVVFDVPRQALRERLKVRFNELGFGTTHGFIALPSIR